MEEYLSENERGSDLLGVMKLPISSYWSVVFLYTRLGARANIAPAAIAGHSVPTFQSLDPT